MIWAIVPVKPLRRGKSRLAGALSENARTELNRQLLEHTLTTLKCLKDITKVLVVSRDPAALAIGRDKGVHTLREGGTPKLNTALTRAAAVAISQSAESILIIPADLPLLNTKDLEILILKSKPYPSVVIAPDRHIKGTNALLVSPPNLINFNFGENSFQIHCEKTKTQNIRLEIVKLPSLELDLDVPEDLVIFDKMKKSTIG